MDVVKRYWNASNSLWTFAKTLIKNGFDDAPLVKDWRIYRAGYELAKAEFLASLGL